MLGIPESWSRANMSPQSIDGSGDEVNDGASSAGTGESLDTIIAAKCSEMVDASAQRGATFVPLAEENGDKYEAMPNLGAREKAFAQALAQELNKGGEIGSRDAITQKMMRELSEAEKKDYKKLGHKEKSDFRLAYAQKKAKHVLQEKTFKQSWKRIDRRHGEYVSATRYWHLEGGQPSDVTPTLNALQKCAAMGFPFCSYNEHTGRYDFLRLRKEFDEELTKAWSLFEKSEIEADPAPAAADTEGTTSERKRKLDAVEAGAVPTPKKSGSRGGGAGSRAASRETSATLTQSLAAVGKLKGRYTAAYSHSVQLTKNIASDPAWSWAAAPAATEGFTKAFQALESASTTDFATLVHTHELTALRKISDAVTLAKSLATYSDTFQPLVEALMAETSKLTRMHMARNS